MTPGREIHDKIALMLRMNNQLETILDRHKGNCKVLEPDATILRASAHSAMQLQQDLRDFFADAERPLFAVTGKAHLVVHSMTSAAFMHPRLSWCYRGEDFMRVWQRLGQNSTRGRSAIQAMKAMSDHFSIGMRLDWKKPSHI